MKTLHAPKTGERVGRYELLEELGRGGFGVVYRARQAGLEADVAIKLLLLEDTAEARQMQLQERFEQEARIIRELEHPAALKVRDFGKTPDGLPYLVTEYVRGRPLDAVLAAEAPFEAARTARIATQVLGCLAEAHYRGVVHRDLKPANIMVRDIFGERDSVKVLDFGIAKVTSGRGQVRTQTGQAFGTPHYIAPEQCKGERDLDGRVDLYALGLIMAECLAGRRIVDSPDPMTSLYIHTSPLPHRFPPPVTRSPLFPVIARATAKERDERYADALAMRAALEAIALGGPAALGEAGAGGVRAGSGGGRPPGPAPGDEPEALGPHTPARPLLPEPEALRRSVGLSATVHPDADVAGGVDDVADTVPIANLVVSEPTRGPTRELGTDATGAEAGERSLRGYLVWAALLVAAAAVGLVLVTASEPGSTGGEGPAASDPTWKAGDLAGPAPTEPAAGPIAEVAAGGSGAGSGAGELPGDRVGSGSGLGVRGRSTVGVGTGLGSGGLGRSAAGPSVE